MNETNHTENLKEQISASLEGTKYKLDLEEKDITENPPINGQSVIERKVSPVIIKFVGGIVDGIAKLWDSFFWGIVTKVDTWLQNYYKKQDEDKTFMLRDVLKFPEQVIEYQIWWNEHNRFMGGFYYVFMMFWGMINNLSTSLLHNRVLIAQEINKEIPVSLPTPEAVLSAVVRHNMPRNIADEMLDKLGFNDDAKQVYLDLAKDVAPVTVLYENFWRNKISGSEFEKQLSRLGYDEDQQVLFTNLIDRIPPIQDLITMAVREAFHDGLSQKYSHDEDFPKDFADWAEKQGFSEYWAKMYWRSHWKLPSPQQSYEMLHRRVLKRNGEVFNEEDIDNLLRMSDYAPEYRNLLKQISYNVLTRVDVRRIYALQAKKENGERFDEIDVYESYLDYGYKPDKAKIMTNFTVQFNLENKRNMVKTELKNLYKKGLVTASYLREKMEELSFLEEDIGFTIMEGEYELQQDKTEKFLKYAQSMYFNGRWSKADVISQMNKAGLPVIDDSRLFEIWDYERQTRRRLPTKSDILNWLESGVLPTPKKAIEYLVDLGYSPEVAGYYVDAKLEEMETN